MSRNELISKIDALNEWEALAAEAAAEIETLKDAIKREMGDSEELIVGPYIVRWTNTLTQRLDTTALKKAMPDVYKSFIKQSASRRFSISA